MKMIVFERLRDIDKLLSKLKDMSLEDRLISGNINSIKRLFDMTLLTVEKIAILVEDQENRIENMEREIKIKKYLQPELYLLDADRAQREDAG